MNPEAMNRMADLLKQAIVDQLNVPYPSQGYFGESKRGFSPRQTRIKNLVKTLQVKWEDDIESTTPMLVVEMENYWYWVDQGRKPSFKYPPLQDIEAWTKAKPLSQFRDKKGRFVSNKTRTFLVARSIKELGYKGINFLTKAENQVINQLTELGETAMVEYFERLIDEGLITQRDR